MATVASAMSKALQNKCFSNNSVAISRSVFPVTSPVPHDAAAGLLLSKNPSKIACRSCQVPRGWRPAKGNSAAQRRDHRGQGRLKT